MIQFCPWLQISNIPISVPFTRISIADSAVWPQSSLLETGQRMISSWDSSRWLCSPDWAADKPSHARVQQSNVFKSVDDTKQGGMANVMESLKGSWEVGDLTAMSLNSKYHLINIDDGKNGLTILCENTRVFWLILSSVWRDLAALKANLLVGCINRIVSKSRQAIISVHSASTGQATADYSCCDLRSIRGSLPTTDNSRKADQDGEIWAVHCTRNCSANCLAWAVALYLLKLKKIFFYFLFIWLHHVLVVACWI